MNSLGRNSWHVKDLDLEILKVDLIVVGVEMGIDDIKERYNK